MNVYEAHGPDRRGPDGRPGCVGVVFEAGRLSSYLTFEPIPDCRWLVVKYDERRRSILPRQNVYIVPFVPTDDYIPNPQDDDHLVYGGYNGNRVYLMNRGVFVPVARIGHCEAIQRDYPDARMLRQHLSDLVTGMVCEVKEPVSSVIRAELPEEDE